jgi:hypothetical protein
MGGISENNGVSKGENNESEENEKWRRRQWRVGGENVIMVWRRRERNGVKIISGMAKIISGEMAQAKNKLNMASENEMKIIENRRSNDDGNRRNGENNGNGESEKWRKRRHGVSSKNGMAKRSIGNGVA